MTWLKFKHGTFEKQYNVITILATFNMLSPETLSKTKQVISNAPYLILSYDKVIVVDNISWISLHCYIFQDIFQFIFILLEYVIKCWSTPISLTTLIMGSLM